MNDEVIVTLQDEHSVNLYRARNHSFIRSVRITSISSGRIIGSPVQSGNRCIITYEEKDGNYVRVKQNSYELPQFRLTNVILVSSRIEEATPETTPSTSYQSESYQDPVQTHSRSSENSEDSSDCSGCLGLLFLWVLYVCVAIIFKACFGITILPGLEDETDKKNANGGGGTEIEVVGENPSVTREDLQPLIDRLRALKCKSADSALYQRRLLALLPLIRNGADVDVTLPETKGNTALHFACALGSWSISKWLVEHGANVNAKTHRGATPMDCLGEDNAARIKKLLQKHGGHYGL